MGIKIGRENHNIITIIVIKTIKTWIISPTNINKNLIMAPIIREIKLERKTSMYLFISNPFPYDHL